MRRPKPGIIGPPQGPVETDSAEALLTRRGFSQPLDNSLGDSAVSQVPQAQRRDKYQAVSADAIHLKNRNFRSEDWGAPHYPRCMCAVNASMAPSWHNVHDSGSGWFLAPCLYDWFKLRAGLSKRTARTVRI